MLNYFLTILIIALPLVGQAQKFVAKQGKVSFFSDAALEDITADNKTATALFDGGSNNIAFSVTIRDFKFAKALMQEHFNEKYMESDKFPKSTFQGQIVGVDFAKSGLQNVMANGKITIHGITRALEIPGTVEKLGDKIVMKSKFSVKLEDYKITIPQLMWQKIAEQVEVTLDFTFAPQ